MLEVLTAEPLGEMGKMGKLGELRVVLESLSAETLGGMGKMGKLGELRVELNLGAQVTPAGSLGEDGKVGRAGSGAQPWS